MEYSKMKNLSSFPEMSPFCMENHKENAQVFHGAFEHCASLPLPTIEFHCLAQTVTCKDFASWYNMAEYEKDTKLEWLN